MSSFHRSHQSLFLLIGLLSLFILAPSAAQAQGTSPQAPSNFNINASQQRVILSWDNDTNAEWYYLWIGAADFSSSVHVQWHQKNSSLCNVQFCTLILDLVGGNYDAWITAWGSGSYATGGYQNSGWANPVSFSLTKSKPGNVSLNVSNAESLKPTFTWQGSESATWYHLWVGTSGSYITHLDQWFVASDLGCAGGGTCTLTFSNNLTNNSRYESWLQIWGPGGYAPGSSTVENWIEGPTFDVGTVPPGGTDFLSAQELEVINLLNVDRKAKGLSCFVPDQYLTEAARAHSTDMRDNDLFSHTGSDGSTFTVRIGRTAYSGSARGENIAAGYSSASAVYQGWYTSQGHYDNMFNANANQIGVALADGGGTYGSYWTMVTGFKSGIDTTCP